MDLKVWDDLPPRIRFKALQGGIILWDSDPTERKEIVQRTLIEYYDHTIWFKRVVEAHLRRGRRMTRLPPDAFRLKEKLAQAERYLHVLYEARTSGSKQELQDDFDLQLKAERAIEVVLQVMLDVCTQIVAEYPEVPETYAGCIDLLAKKGVIPADLAQRIMPAVRMRNIIVHQYAAIDYSVLFEAMGVIVDDFAAHREAVLSWLDSQSTAQTL